MIHFLLLNEQLPSELLITRIEQAHKEDTITCLNCHSLFIDDSLASSIRSPQWEHIELVSCHGQLGMLLEGLPSLRHMTLRKVACPDSFSAISRGLSNCLSLKELRLEVSLTTSNAAELGQALAQNSTITKFNLYGSSFESLDAIGALAEGLSHNRHLQHLDVSYCQLRDEGVSLLVEQLVNHPALLNLDLSGNYCRSDSMVSIVKLLLQEDHPLKVLNLTNQHAGEFGGSFDITALGLAMRSNRSLESLDLSFNMLYDDDISNLVAALSKNTTLKVLNLMSNQLTTKGISTIAEYLSRWKGLQKLIVACNRFGEEGARSLLEGLQENTELTHLGMPRGFAVSEDIQHLLALNQGGRKLLLHKEHVPSGLWPLVLARVNEKNQPISLLRTRATVMFYLLQGPALFGRQWFESCRTSNFDTSHFTLSSMMKIQSLVMVRSVAYSSVKLIRQSGCERVTRVSRVGYISHGNANASETTI